MTANLSGLDGCVAASACHALWAQTMIDNDWITVSGLTIPNSFGASDTEFAATQATIGLCEISYRSVLQFSGADRRDFLAWALIMQDGLGEPGTSAEVCWVDDSGWLRGTGALFAFSNDRDWLISDVFDLAWFRDGALGFDVEVAALNAPGADPALQGLALCGPENERLLHALDCPPDGGLWTWQDALCAVRKVSASCCELWAPSGIGPALATSIFKSGVPFGLQSVGFAAAEAYRVRSLAPRAGVDWIPVQSISLWEEARTPAHLGIKVQEGPFSGQAGLLRRAAPGQILALLREGPLAPSQVRNGPATALSAYRLAWIPNQGARKGSVYHKFLIEDLLSTD